MTLVALVALLIVWIVTQGGGGKKKPDDNNGGAAPATSITPGPSGSGPAISEAPGGRDESGGGGDTSGDTGGGGDDGGKNGDTSGDTSGTSDTGGSGPGTTQLPGGTGAAGAGGVAGGTGAVGTGGAGGAGGSTGRAVSAGSTLPTCVANALTLRLDSTKVAYEPGEKPSFRLVATNTSNTACKADFGPKAVVLTITNANDDDVWSSKDCPKTGSAFFEVPAGATITRVVQWDRKQSAPNCPTPAAKAKAVGPGTYLVEVKTSGASVQLGQKSIRLDKD